MCTDQSHWEGRRLWRLGRIRRGRRRLLRRLRRGVVRGRVELFIFCQGQVIARSPARAQSSPGALHRSSETAPTRSDSTAFKISISIDACAMLQVEAATADSFVSLLCVDRVPRPPQLQRQALTRRGTSRCSSGTNSRGSWPAQPAALPAPPRCPAQPRRRRAAPPGRAARRPARSAWRPCGA